MLLSALSAVIVRLTADPAVSVPGALTEKCVAGTTLPSRSSKEGRNFGRDLLRAARSRLAKKLMFVGPIYRRKKDNPQTEGLGGNLGMLLGAWTPCQPHRLYRK